MITSAAYQITSKYNGIKQQLPDFIHDNLGQEVGQVLLGASHADAVRCCLGTQASQGSPGWMSRMDGSVPWLAADAGCQLGAQLGYQPTTWAWPPKQLSQPGTVVLPGTWLMAAGVLLASGGQRQGSC